MMEHLVSTVWSTSRIEFLLSAQSFRTQSPKQHHSCVLCGCVFQVVDVSKRISDVPEWFKGAQLNYAENLLKHADQDKVALYAASEYKSCAGVRGDAQDAVKPRSSWTAGVVPSLKHPHTHRDCSETHTLFSLGLSEARY